MWASSASLACHLSIVMPMEHAPIHVALHSFGTRPGRMEPLVASSTVCFAWFQRVPASGMTVHREPAVNDVCLACERLACLQLSSGSWRRVTA